MIINPLSTSLALMFVSRKNCAKKIKRIQEIKNFNTSALTLSKYLIGKKYLKNTNLYVFLGVNKMIKSFLSVTFYLVFFPSIILSNQIITHHEQTDGFGSQFQNIISTVVYAEFNNKEYVYTPFRNMEHNYDGETSFIEKKEWLINFLNNFPLNNGKAIPLANCKIFFDSNVKKYSESSSLKKIKGIFRDNKDIEKYFDSQQFNIAVHVRRPNCHDNRLLRSDIPDNFFLKIIHNLRRIYADKNPVFHLYSQGALKNFEVFKSSDVVFHLDESIEDTFTAMVLADVLVISPSSFSYAAGLISNGIVYYIPFWHTPLPNWNNVHDLK